MLYYCNYIIYGVYYIYNRNESVRAAFGARFLSFENYNIAHPPLLPFNPPPPPQSRNRVRSSGARDFPSFNRVWNSN